MKMDQFKPDPILSIEDVKRCREIALQGRGMVNKIAEAVAAETGVGIREIYGKRRTKRVVEARQLVMFIATQHGLTTHQIGGALNRDHSTVSHAVAAEKRRRGMQ